MGSPNWTEADTETLKFLRAKGYSASQISAALGGRYSRNACIGRAARLGLSAPSITRHIERKKPRPVIKAPVPAVILEPLGPVGDFPDRGFCQYPMNALDAPFQCCGRPNKPLKPYCHDHSAVAFVPPKAKA